MVFENSCAQEIIIGAMVAWIKVVGGASFRCERVAHTRGITVNVDIFTLINFRASSPM